MAEITTRDMTGGSSSAVEGTKQVDTNSGAPSHTAEAKPVPEAKDPRLAALAKQQQAIRQQQRMVESERRQFEADRAAYNLAQNQGRKDIDDAKAWKTRLTQDPYGVMLESGLTADQVASLMLNQPNPADQRVVLLERKLAELEAAQGKTLSKFDEVQKQQYEDAKRQIHSDVVSVVGSDPAYETIKAMNAQAAVTDLIEETFKQDGRLMTVEEASKEVEDYLVEEGMKIAALGKVQSRLKPPAPPATEAPQKQVQQQKQTMTTLSNRMVQSATQPMSGKERRERAIAAFQGNKLS